MSRHKKAKRAAVRYVLILMAKELLPNCLGTDTKIGSFRAIFLRTELRFNAQAFLCLAIAFLFSFLPVSIAG